MSAHVVDFQRLRLAQPGPTAGSAEIAAWYEAKADVFDAIAADTTTPPEEQDRARLRAYHARIHAAELRMVNVA
ncbi:hypothetical protein EV191_101928 [Tamaricihabitans halophyticus]|uniref:Uncharacterized protein n=1 Tax=Tamaricihabitans halophyticus TaxID=1262583 RepID=A0A4R2R5F6_9PSEU|nr:hypothetical protein [Tamaricihabitans halophyticus]TCP56978.1 hypothetical protein EV191_101928 [Tamaricihabitans halophyticus]